MALRARFEFHDESDGCRGVVGGGAEGVDLCFVVDHDAHVEALGGARVHGWHVSHDEEIARVAVVAQVGGFVERVDA